MRQGWEWRVGRREVNRGWRELILLGLLAGCGWGSRSAAPSPSQVVLLVSLDTTRADHLGPYGHPEAVTPHLDQLASEGMVFERHIAAAPTTLASHTTLMTGNYPHTHGISRNIYTVSSDNEMLAEVFEEEGWRTAAFLGAMPLQSASGFTQGFQHVDETFSRTRGRDLVDQAERGGDEVTDAVLSWIDGEGRGDGEPVFLFVHYFDPHAPYAPPEPYRSMYGDVTDPDAGSMKYVHKTRSLGKRGSERVAQRHAALQRLYLGEISWTDAQLGRLVDGLKARGWYDQAMVIVTADHGETQVGHSEVWNHGYTVYDETVRIPLLMRLPDSQRAGARVRRLVGNLDLYPTLLEWFSFAPRDVEGESFVPLLRGEAMAERAPVFSEATKPYVPQGDSEWRNDLRKKSASSAGLKVHFDPMTEAWELYDLTEDPDEADNLHRDEDTSRGESLRRALGQWRDEADPLPAPEQGSDQTRRQLEALGYVDEGAE